MVQRRSQLGQRRQPLDPETMAQCSRGPISPGRRKGHPSGRASLAHEHQVGSRTTALQDDH